MSGDNTASAYKSPLLHLKFIKLIYRKLVFCPMGCSVDMIASGFLWVSPPLGANVSSLIQRLNDLLQQAEASKKECEEMIEELEGKKAPVNHPILMKLQECKMTLEKLSEEVAKKIQKLSMKDIGVPSLFAISERSIDLIAANPTEMETYGSP